MAQFLRFSQSATDKKMSGLSIGDIFLGRVFNGYDYALQVWVKEGIIQRCGHPDSMRPGGRPCCNAFKLAGKSIHEVKGAEEHK